MTVRRLNGYDWFIGSAYFAKLRTSLLSDVVAKARPILLNCPYDAESVAEALDNEFGATSGSSVIATQHEAFEALVRLDLQAIRDRTTDSMVIAELTARQNMPDTLARAAERGASLLRQAGLHDLVTPELHFVESFPAPYSESRAAIIATDDGDRQKFGIDPGLYIKQTYRPIYSEFIVYHELIHTYLGQLSPELFCSNFEEGLADLIGSGWVGTRVFTEPLVENLFVLNRLSRLNDPAWERYVDALRQALSFMMVNGFDGVVQLIRSGREGLQEAERHILEGRDLAERHVHSGAESPLRRIVTSICLKFPRSLVVSPAAALVAPHAVAGASLREVATASRVGIELVHDVCEELQNIFGLLALRPDSAVIAFSNADMIASTGAMRYGSSDV